MTIYDRIKNMRLKRNMSQYELALKVGYEGRSAISKVEKGERDISQSMIAKYAEALGVSPSYLLYGEESTTDNDTSAREKGVRIPVIGPSAAGLPIYTAQEYIDDNNPDTWEEISASMANSGDYVAIRIKGDSMEPRIMDGDIVIVRIQPDIDSGETAIVIVNGDEATCKKIKKRPDGIMLISNNPKYDPMFYFAREVQTLPVRIYGRVVEVRGRL